MMPEGWWWSGCVLLYKDATHWWCKDGGLGLGWVLQVRCMLVKGWRLPWVAVSQELTDA